MTPLSSLCFTRFSLSGQQMFWPQVKYVSVRLPFPAQAIHLLLSFLCHNLYLLHHLFKNKQTFLSNSGDQLYLLKPTNLADFNKDKN